MIAYIKTVSRSSEPSEAMDGAASVSVWKMTLIFLMTFAILIILPRRSVLTIIA